MKTKECPSCAMEIDSINSECPVCGYEFPETSHGIKWIALVLVILFLLIIFIL